MTLSDALALVPEVDGTMLVCRHEVSYVSDIAKTLNTLKFAKANVLGVVVNDYTTQDGERYKYYAYADEKK